MANIADPDQLASQKPTDLDLHCLQMQVIPGSAGPGLKYLFLPASASCIGLPGYGA